MRADLGVRDRWDLLLSFDREHAGGVVLRGGGDLRGAGAVLGAGDTLLAWNRSRGRDRDRELDRRAGGIRRALRNRLGKEGNRQISSYVFVFKKSKNYDIKSMDSQVLKRIKIGFESDTPVEGGLKMRGLVLTAEAFDVGSNSGESPLSMLNALQQGQIDILITWQPAISSFLSRFPGLEVVAVPNARTLGSPEQYAFPMSMGVRQGNEPLQKQLDGVIAARKGELSSILTRYGVKFLTSQ